MQWAKTYKTYRTYKTYNSTPKAKRASSNRRNPKFPGSADLKKPGTPSSICKRRYQPFTKIFPNSPLTI